MLGFGYRPESPQEVLKNISEELIGSFTLGNTMHLTSMGGPGLFSPFGGLDHKFLTGKRMRGEAANIKADSLVYYGLGLGNLGSDNGGILHCVSVERAGLVVYQDDHLERGREAVASGIFRILNGFDHEESHRLAEAERIG